MLNRNARALVTRILSPVASLLIRLGISPDAVTIIGTIGVVASSLWFYSRGQLLIGTLAICLFIFSDTLDGIMARKLERPGSWGAFLDSTLDRLADAAIFSGLILWFIGGGNNNTIAALALLNLVLGSVVSYARARAEGLGMNANVGIAERAERLVAVLLATGFVGWFLPPIVLLVVLAILAALSTVTVIQRVLAVRAQALHTT